MTTFVACSALLLHLLPPYRPLVQRIKTAEAVAVIEVGEVTHRRVTFRTLAALKGPALSQANVLPGHRPTRQARRGLATFRRLKGQWTMQEQGREWLEMERHEWQAHPTAAWTRWIQGLRQAPQATLLQSMTQTTFARFAVRDLNALMLQPTQHALRKTVAQRMAQTRQHDARTQSLKRHVLAGATARERAQLQRCMASLKACVGQ